MPNTTHSICVFCGSRSGIDPAYHAAASEVGTWLASQGHELVYGAGDVGLMGAVAQATQDAGGRTLGVIPVHLLSVENGRRDLSRFVITETMHERKKVMFMNSDAIVVLPGGAGSLDEFFEVLTWGQLGLHSKPVFLLNTNGFWDPLDKLVHHVVTEGFADGSLATFYECVPDVATLAERLTRRLDPGLGS
ncbi:MAG: hypothetical protein ACI9KS_000138 [Sulfitobacter sp.]|jgi:uncharacterized protein (TIGR00730 family)